MWTLRGRANRPSVPSLVVDGREDVGVGPHPAQLEERALGAPQVQQEVVHQAQPPRRAVTAVPVEVGVAGTSIRGPDRATRLPGADGVAVVRQLFRRIRRRRARSARSCPRCRGGRASCCVACPEGPLAASARDRGGIDAWWPSRGHAAERPRRRPPTGCSPRSGCVAHAPRGARAGPRPGARHDGRRVGDAVGARRAPPWPGAYPVAIAHHDVLPGPVIAAAVRAAAAPRAAVVVVPSRAVALDLDPGG